MMKGMGIAVAECVQVGGYQCGIRDRYNLLCLAAVYHLIETFTEVCTWPDDDASITILRPKISASQPDSQYYVYPYL